MIDIATRERRANFSARIFSARIFSPRILSPRIFRAGTLVAIVALGAATSSARAAETCRFEGAGDHDGRVSITTVARVDGDSTHVDVAIAFEATQMGFWRIRYLVDEISTVRAGALLSVATNTRQLSGDRVVRQTWDVFSRAGDGLEARRIQGKYPDEFRARYPAFASHWDPATFGAPWLDDFVKAGAERRPDLDFAPLPAGARSPFAAAFYWVRRLPRDGGTIPVFLPGFKTDKSIDLSLTGNAAPGGDTVLRAPLRYVSLSDDPPSAARATVSPDGHLLELALDLHGKRGSGRGDIRATGCQGAE